MKTRSIYFILLTVAMTVGLTLSSACSKKKKVQTKTIASSDEAVSHKHGKEETEASEHKEHGEKHENEHGEEHAFKPIELPKDSQQLISLKTEKVIEKPLQHTATINGRILPDPDEVSTCQAGHAGKVENLTAQIGSFIEKGTLLGTIRAHSQRDEHQVTSIKACQTGTVYTLHAKPGESVETSTPILGIVDNTKLKAIFDVYEKDLALVRLGSSISVRALAYPNETFEGNVVFLSPRVDEHSRTVAMQVLVKNKDGILRYGMYLKGILSRNIGGAIVAVPKEAVQMVEGKPIVFIQKGETTFMPRELILGNSNATHVEVKSGLQIGEEVVTEGSFLLKGDLMKSELGE